MEIFTTRVKTNLDGVLQMTQMMDGIMMTGDNSANQILVELYRGSSRIEIDPETKIVGYFIRSDGETLEIDGEVTSNNEVKVIIPEAAYQVSGALSIAIRMFSDPSSTYNPDTGITYETWSTKIVVATLSCFVQITETDSIIDIYHHIPDVQELLSYIDILDQKRNEIIAEEALRVSAESERSSAEAIRAENETTRIQSETERVSHEIERESAETNRISNENARDSLEDIRISNENTRISNESTRTSSEATRVSNESARISAELQRVSDTQSRLNSIDNMTVGVTKQAAYSNPTVSISEVNGHKHIQFGLVPGDPFVIRKTFASVFEMNTYEGTDINVGQFAIITSNVEDPDNAKLYIKTDDGFSFITDLSGATGLVGPQGETGVSIESIELLDNYKLKIYFDNGSSYTTENSIRGEIGPQGETGNGIANAELLSDYRLKLTYTDGSTYTTPNPIRGVIGETGNGIASAELLSDYKLKLTYTDGTTYTTENSIRGPIGKGIASITRNADYTLTITLDDGSTYTTDPVKGEPGAQGTSFTLGNNNKDLTVEYF